MAFTSGPDLIDDVAPGTVLQAGGRRRRRRRIAQVAGGVAAVLLVGGGVAVATVPSEGTLLSPAVSTVRGWFGHGTSLEADGRRYTVVIAGHGNGEVLIAVLGTRDDGTPVNLGGPPVETASLPAIGGTTGLAPRVVFGLFPAGTHDVRAQTPGDRYAYTVSQMDVTDPVDGREYVAVAVTGASYDAITQITAYTWLDADGNVRTTPAY